MSDEVYQGLETVAAGRTTSEFFEELVRPIVNNSCLEASYTEMPLDSDRELRPNHDAF